MLAVAGEEDLRTFIRHESRRSNSLSIRLKTQFIESITLKPGLNKYAILLDEVLSLDTHSRLELGSRDIALLNYIAESLLDTAKSHVNMRAYRDATEVLTTLLQKLHATVDKYGYDDPVVIENLLESYKLLEHLLHSDPAPELRDRIFRFGISLVDKPYYRLPDMRFNIVPILMEACPDLRARDEIIDNVVRRLRGSSDKAFWASWYCILNERYGTQPDSDLLSRQLSGSQIFTAVTMIEKIGAPGAYDLALGVFGPDLDLSATQEIEWARKLFQYAGRTGDTALALRSGLQILSTTSDSELLDTLVELLEGHPEIRRTLAARLREEGNLPFLARLNALEGNHEGLLEVVNASRSVQLAGQYADILMTFAPEETRRVILDTVVHYVTHHAGIICNANITQLLEILNEHGHRGLAKEIRAVLKNIYPGRFEQI